MTHVHTDNVIFFCDNRHDSPWQAENEELIQRFRLGMGSSCGFQSLLAMLAEHSLWGALRSLKCRNIFVSLWKLIEEKGWSAVFASLNILEPFRPPHWYSWLICLYLFMSSWLNDVPVWLLDIPVFARFKVKPCVSAWLMFSLIQCLVNMLSATLAFAQTHDCDITEQYVDWGNNINFIFMRDQNSPPPMTNMLNGVITSTLSSWGIKIRHPLWTICWLG